MIPNVLRLKSSTNNEILNLLIYVIIARYFYLFIYSYINIHDGITHVNSVRIFSSKFLFIIFLKSVFDFIIMSLFSAILFLKTKIYIKKRFEKLK